MPPISCYVIVIDKTDPDGVDLEFPVSDELQAKADTFMCPIYDDNNVMYFNGNDAMVLKNTSLTPAYIVDRIGKVGEDPGYQGWNDVAPDYTFASNGETGWTQNHSLIRKNDIMIGYLGDAGATFDVSEEWDSIPANFYDDDGAFVGGNWASVGVHTCDCGDVVSGVSEIDNLSFTIYPNPANDHFIIESESAIVNATIYSVNGVKVYDISTNSQRLEVETSEWTKGYYLVNLRLENGYVFSKKVMVQ